MNKEYLNSIYKKLTEREREILELILQGKSNNNIATLLYITNNTVKIHISNIVKKLNDGNPPAGATVPRRPLPSGGGNSAVEEISSLLEKRISSST